MSDLEARVVSVHSGDHEDLHKDAVDSVEIDFEGFPGDAHRGFTRVAWKADKDPEGTVRTTTSKRNAHLRVRRG